MPSGFVEKPATYCAPIPAAAPAATDLKPTGLMFEGMSLPASGVSTKRSFTDASMGNPETEAMEVPPAIDVEMTAKADELNSMNDYEAVTKKTLNAVEDVLPEQYNVDDIILELQRQTVSSMMDELVNISDILAASQLDMYNSTENDLPSLEPDLAQFSNYV